MWVNSNSLPAVMEARLALGPSVAGALMAAVGTSQNSAVLQMALNIGRSLLFVAQQLCAMWRRNDVTLATMVENMIIPLILHNVFQRWRIVSLPAWDRYRARARTNPARACALPRWRPVKFLQKTCLLVTVPTGDCNDGSFNNRFNNRVDGLACQRVCSN